MLVYPTRQLTSDVLLGWRTITTMALSPGQLEFYEKNGYLAYDDHPLLTADEWQAIGARVEDIARGKVPNLPEEVYSVVGAVRRGDGANVDPFYQYRILRVLLECDVLV